tara:strand:+ start:126 stop:1043 length:918 start_codon:yes stop_codon:yes gene_type:complete
VGKNQAGVIFMKKILLILLISFTFIGSANAYSEQNENEIVKTLNEGILTSYEQENFKEVEELLEVYFRKCYFDTHNEADRRVKQIWAARDQRIRKLNKLFNEAQEAYVEVLNRCKSSLDTDDLSEKLSCVKEVDEALEKTLEAMNNLEREKSLIIDVREPVDYALGYCSYWIGEVKSKLGLDYYFWRESDAYTLWLKERENEKKDLEAEHMIWLEDVKSKVRSFWNYEDQLDVQDDWYCKVGVTQDTKGNVVGVGIKVCNPRDEASRPFWVSIKDAVFMASPLPKVANKKNFRSQFSFTFAPNKP